MMRTGIKFLCIAVVVIAVVAVSRASARPAGQTSSHPYFTPDLQGWMQGGGSELGVSVRDVEQADIAREKLSGAAGAVIEEVRSESPAAKAGLKAGDVVVDFDGERVRSARQLDRLVDETPAGREVKMAVMRGGQRVDVTVAPTPANGLAVFENGRGLQRLERFGPNLQFDMPEWREYAMPHFDFDMRSRPSRLGVTLSELTSQLSEHLGAKQGVLVTEVTADSPARTAGIKAGDVIATIDGKAVTSSNDVRRAIADAASDEVTIGIVRDKKEMALKAKIERPERVRRSVRRTV
jgi:serine protease Do